MLRKKFVGFDLNLDIVQRNILFYEAIECFKLLKNKFRR